ncbi:hypothetical protein QCA50_014294 [Cerrena zonata]|uniref:Alcohol dehydrogenase-like C-terminal domain-containing protein n=1 Tax=Cerrena zonata TaxID=2478898 RepID=A0AAW0FWB5_9APHY
MFVSNLQNRCAAFQQYAVVKAAVATKVPANISFDEAATIPCNFITAVNGLYIGPVPRMERGGAGLVPFWRTEGRGKYIGQPIVIVGASSSVGQYALQLARFSGFTPIIGVASLRNTAYLKSLGATHVVDRTLPRETVLANIRHITTWPISVVFDSVGFSETQNLGYDILSSAGTLIVVLPPAVDPARLTPDKHVYMAHGSPYPPEYTATDMEIYKLLPILLAKGEVKPNIPEYLSGGLGSIPEGLGMLRRNEVSAKKLVIRPPETIQ